MNINWEGEGKDSFVRICFIDLITLIFIFLMVALMFCNIFHHIYDT